MDNSFMVGLSAQQVLQKRMDTTAGFKVEHVVARELSQKPATADDLPHEISFADAYMLQRDFSTGPLEQTGNPLDFAIEGDGFFEVQTANGAAYTRDGRFNLNEAGEIITRNGDLVVGDGGPITVNTDGGPLSVSREGSISQDGVVLGKMKVMQFQTPGALERVGSNLWKATDQQPTPADTTTTRVVSGMVEGSNVNAVLELTEMIEVSRAYTSIAKMISQSDELRGTSIDKLARVG